MSDGLPPVVTQYEVFRNERDALAFFFYRQPELDRMPEAGPFWFSIRDSSIHAGSEDHFAIFENLSTDLIETARQRGVIMLVEFEDQAAMRCTPCYLAA